MKSKVEYLKQSNGLKVYVRNNSLLESEAKIIDSMLFNSWRCGYVDFSLPNGMGYQVVESIYPRHNEYVINKPSKIAEKIERVIDGALVHGGITYCDIDYNTKKITLGFDCNHYQDTKGFIKEPRSLGYCKTNLISLSKAVLKVKKNYRRYLIEQKIKELKKKKKVNLNKTRSLFSGVGYIVSIDPKTGMPTKG